MRLYFAYGSNMGLDELSKPNRCPNARQVGIARIDDSRLGFTRYSEKRGGGVADLVEAPTGVVWGALFEISDDELGQLDRVEGHPRAYVRRPWTVTRPDGVAMEAWVYTVVDKKLEQKPSHEYWRLLVDGATQAGLPAAYVAELEKLDHL